MDKEQSNFTDSAGPDTSGHSPCRLDEDWFDRNTIAVVLAPNVAGVFPSSESAILGLRTLIQVAQLPPPVSTRVIEEVDLDDDLSDEVDFSGAVRGKHAHLFPPNPVFVVLPAEVARFFPSPRVVDAALRILILAAQYAVKQAGQQSA